MPVPLYEQERNGRAVAIRRQLPDLVREVSLDLKRKVQWAPYLSAAPAAICVMATCLVAGSSPSTGSIEVDIPPFEMNGISIKPHKYLGTNLQYCSDLGKRAFGVAENGMQTLQNRADFMTGRTGPLAQIVSVLNDTHPDFESLEMWMKELSDAATACRDEANTMRQNFEALLEFILRLKRASEDAMHENKKQLQNEEKATKNAAQNKYKDKIRQAEKQKATLEGELEDARNRSLLAREKMKKVLKENPWEETQEQIDEINHELHKIEKCGPNTWTVFGRFFGNPNRARKEQDKRKRGLLDKRRDLLRQREKYINFDQTCVINDVEACQSQVGDAERRLRTAQDTLSALMQEQFQCSKPFDEACEDLSRLSDTSLDLKAIDEILLRSIRALRDLNKYITKMTKFFIQVSSQVDDIMRSRLQLFKRQTGDVKRGESLRTSEENNKHKTLAIIAALDLHGRFTFMRNIAGVYVSVSTDYIIPGIEQMDDLTFLDDDEFKDEMVNFRKWGDESVAAIGELADVENLKIEDAVLTNMALLVKKQIETGCPAEADDDSGDYSD